MRTPTKEIVKKIAEILKNEHPDYIYLRDLFKKIRQKFEIVVTTTPKHLPYIPTEDELKRYYEVVWQAKDIKHMFLIKTLIYTGVKVQELVNIKIDDIDFDKCQIRINHENNQKDRIVLFPESFRETFMVYVKTESKNGKVYLFESNRKMAFTTRGIRKILANYSKEAGMQQSLSPNKLRHFLLNWLKKQGIDDRLIQPYSGHKNRQSLEIYSKASLADAQKVYSKAIEKFPI